MTVKEYIEELKKFPPDYECVSLYDPPFAIYAATAPRLPKGNEGYYGEKEMLKDAGFNPDKSVIIDNS